jgi:hypothetical protein
MILDEVFGQLLLNEGFKSEKFNHQLMIFLFDFKNLWMEPLVLLVSGCEGFRVDLKGQFVELREKFFVLETD